MSRYGLKKTYCWDIECLPPGGLASIKVIHRSGLTDRAAATEVHLSQRFYRWHQVTLGPRWGWDVGLWRTGRLVVCWHTGRQQHLGEGNMQPPAFRGIDSCSTNSPPRPQDYGFYWFVRSVNRMDWYFFIGSSLPLNNCHNRTTVFPWPTKPSPHSLIHTCAFLIWLIFYLQWFSHPKIICQKLSKKHLTKNNITLHLFSPVQNGAMLKLPCVGKGSKTSRFQKEGGASTWPGVCLLILVNCQWGISDLCDITKCSNCLLWLQKCMVCSSSPITCCTAPCCKQTVDLFFLCYLL